MQESIKKKIEEYKLELPQLIELLVIDEWYASKKLLGGLLSQLSDIMKELVIVSQTNVEVIEKCNELLQIYDVIMKTIQVEDSIQLIDLLQYDVLSIFEQLKLHS